MVGLARGFSMNAVNSGGDRYQRKITEPLQLTLDRQHTETLPFLNGGGD